mgnify:FL=1
MNSNNTEKRDIEDNLVVDSSMRALRQIAVTQRQTFRIIFEIPWQSLQSMPPHDMGLMVI